MTHTTADLVRTMLRVSRDGLTGLLGVRSESSADGQPTLIYFLEGTPVFASGGDERDTLDNLLLARGILTAEQALQTADRLAKRDPADADMGLGEVLVVMGILSVEDIRDALTHMVERRIQRCLCLNKMTLSFNPLKLLPSAVGRFPVEIEPTVLDGVRRHFDKARSEHYLSGVNKAFLSTLEEPDGLIDRFRANAEDSLVIERLDGSERLAAVADRLVSEGLNPYPMLTSLVLCGMVSAARSSRAPSLRPSRAPRRTLQRSEKPPVSGAPNSQRPRPEIRTSRKSAAPGRVRAQSSSVRAQRSDPAVRSRSSAPGVRSSSAPAVRSRSSAPRTSDRPRNSDLPRRSSQPGHGPRATNPWRNSDPTALESQPPASGPARISGVELGSGSIRARPSQPVSGSHPTGFPEDGVLSRVQAEKAFQRGKRFLRAEQYARAAVELSAAAAALPDRLEVDLYARWASYRSCELVEEQAYLRSELEPLAKLLAKEDRAHELPPYVLGHIALTQEQMTRALKLFKMALKLDPRNRDAERHIRLLSMRTGSS